MGDKIYMLLLLLVVVGGVGAALYYFVLPKGNDVRNIDHANQERAKPSKATSAPTVSKTAQLSALRERLADAQTSPTGLKKLSTKTAEPVRTAEAQRSWRPEESGLGAPEPAALATPPTERAAKPAAARHHGDSAQPSTQESDLFAVPPLAPAVVPAGRVEPPAAPAGPALHAEAKVHILLVDDSKVVRVKAEKLLINKGYLVTTAVDGIDALAKLETLRPTIIITDIEMPNLDGFGLVRNVRGNLRTSEIPVIVMTSHVNLHLDVAATEGINGFLPKPFNDQDLLDQVAFLCES